MIIMMIAEVQVSCKQAGMQYVPALWVMCLESVAHLLVMFNCSSNFLVYCSVSHQFKAALSRVCRYFCGHGGPHRPSPGYYLCGWRLRISAGKRVVISVIGNPTIVSPLSFQTFYQELSDRNLSYLL